MQESIVRVEGYFEKLETLANKSCLLFFIYYYLTFRNFFSVAAEVPKNEKQPKIYSGPTWQNVNHGPKVENSWHTGPSQNGEPTLLSRTAVTNEARSKEPKNSPKTKSKKQSPRHAINSKASTPTIDTLASDSSRISSECSSVTTTPPPQHPPPQHAAVSNHDAVRFLLSVLQQRFSNFLFITSRRSLKFFPVCSYWVFVLLSV